MPTRNELKELARLLLEEAETLLFNFNKIPQSSSPSSSPSSSSLRSKGQASRRDRRDSE